MPKPEAVDTIAETLHQHMSMGIWNWQFRVKSMSILDMAKIIASALEDDDDKEV